MVILFKYDILLSLFYFMIEVDAIYLKERDFMLFKIDLVEQKAQPVLAIRARTNLTELPKIIGENYGKIMGYLSQLREEVSDAPYTAYFNMDMQDLDVEMGFPVAKVLPGHGEVQAGEIPAGKYVCCIYKGPYSGMEQPYQEIFKWIEQKGYKPTGVYYEYYYNSPADVPESELLTRIAIPVIA